jgi:hypothetical protein
MSENLKYLNKEDLNKLDEFIQESLDKYYYVKAWDQLYNNTGKNHKDIISDKSTIPDLVIYNKGFNKLDCFYYPKVTKEKVKFPRKLFILKPKKLKQYDPSSAIININSKIQKEKKEEKKEEIKEKKKDENKKEKKKEIKEDMKEEKKDENKDEIKEEKKDEENKGNNDNIPENTEKYKTSSFRKIFKNKSEFLTGIQKEENSLNNVNVFVPNIYIKELDSEYQLIIYLTNDLMFFLFLDKNFEIVKQIDQLEKIPKRINKYFKDQLNDLHDLEKISNSDNNIFCYKNGCNKSIKFSGFINKKNNNFDWKLFETLQKSLFINGETKMTSLAKYRGYYIYYINSIEQEVLMFYQDKLTLTQIKQEIEKTKKTHFDNLFLY